jgi:TRAP-type C4-dicarboxylate transport system permease small subunit
VNRFGVRIERAIDLVLDKIRWLAAGLLFLMGLLTTVDVIGRYVFHKPIKGNIDIQELMMVVIIFLGVGYCTLKERNASADVVLSRLARHTRAILGVITWFLCTAIYGLISWQITKWGLSEISSPTRASYLLAIKQWPYISVAALGCITVCVASLANFFRSLAQVRARREPKS